MARLIVKVKDYRVVKTENKMNQYTVKQRYFSMVDCGWHERTVVKYSDLKSCMYYLAEAVTD